MTQAASAARSNQRKAYSWQHKKTAGRQDVWPATVELCADGFMSTMSGLTVHRSIAGNKTNVSLLVFLDIYLDRPAAAQRNHG